ncbi:MAG: ABC transporter ATP-binding protein [Candidatus Thiodiazotropha sp. (ex Monitilora ramsayi)]|nr:ABC transporter ATP-binding protein [Candidatus Thiodiazotropha sp. (ex Monitilora ramsayi)]
MAAIRLNRVSKHYDDHSAVIEEMDLEIRDGELLVLVGPSGCGKSTLLRMIAGLEEISTGEILIDSQAIHHLPPQKRNLAMVFQNYALYPHMTVKQNLAFPLKMQQLTQDEVSRRVTQTAELLGLGNLLSRHPKQLSGGQRQRVAMGRAMVRDTNAFLMDEPLSNLDAKLRVELRGEIAALQKRLSITTLYVTHDQVEAMTLGDRVAVMRAGKLQQIASPGELYEHPVNVFVSGFIGNPGMNVLRSMLETADKVPAFRLGKYCLPLTQPVMERYPDLRNGSNQMLLLGIRPSAITLAESDERDSLPARVSSAEPLGHETILYVDADIEAVATDAEDPGSTLLRRPTLTVIIPGHRHFKPGETVYLQVDNSKLHCYDLQGDSLSPLSS